MLPSDLPAFHQPGGPTATLDPPAIRIISTLLLLVGSLLVLIAYWPGLDGPLLFDDMPAIGALVNGGERPLAELLRHHLVSTSGPLGRPVAMLSFIGNALLNGDQLWAWKLTNLLIHVINGWLVYLVTARLARLQPGVSAASTQFLACAVALLWLLHPLHVSTVLYTVQRMALLSALFNLLGLLAYLAGRVRLEQQRRHGHSLLLFSVVGCVPLAALAKENGVLLLLFLPLVELQFRLHAGSAAAKRRATRYMYAMLSVIGLMAAAVLIYRPDLITVSGFATRPFSLSERLLTESRVLVRYAAMTLLPLPSWMGFFHDGMTLSRGWLDPPQTALSIGLLALLTGGAVRYFRSVPLFSFGIGLFVCGHLLESTIIALDLMYEHRQYLPSYGLLLAVGALLPKLRLPRQVMLLLAVVSIATTTLLTAGRAHGWGEEWRLYAQLLKASPDSPTLNVIVANRLVDKLGRFDKARAMLARFPSPASELNRRFLDCLEHGSVTAEELDSIGEPEIISFYEKAGLINLGLAGIEGRCNVPAGAYDALATRWLAKPQHANGSPLYIYLAHYRHRERRLEAALQALESAYALAPHSPVPLYLAGEWLIDSGQLGRAEHYLERGMAVDRRHWNRRRELADAALARLRLAREDPASLVPFDPFK